MGRTGKDLAAAAGLLTALPTGCDLMIFVSSKDEGNEDTVSLLEVEAACDCEDGAFKDEQDGISGNMEHSTGVEEPVTLAVECKELDIVDERAGLTGSGAFINPIMGEELISGQF